MSKTPEQEAFERAVKALEELGEQITETLTESFQVIAGHTQIFAEQLIERMNEFSDDPYYQEFLVELERAKEEEE